MGKFDGILICTDLDGTLFKRDKTVSIENKTAIEYFKREGGYFTFITGRMPYYSQSAYEAVNPNVPYGCINGGGIYDGEKERYVWNCSLADGFCDLIQVIDEKLPAVGIQVCAHYRTYFAKDNEVTARFRRATKVPHLVSPYRSVTEKVGKILFCTDNEEEILAVEKELKSHPLANNFDFIRSERALYEILPKGVNKGLALNKLVEHLHLDAKKTIAVGDYDNDIGMFKVAGCGVAVANACDRALASADYVTVSNEESAIARIIYDIEEGKLVL